MISFVCSRNLPDALRGRGRASFKGYPLSGHGRFNAVVFLGSGFFVAPCAYPHGSKSMSRRAISKHVAVKCKGT